MAISVQQLQMQLDALRTAYNTGAQSVSYEGKSTTFRSGEEMRAAIGYLEDQLNGLQGANQPRTLLVRGRKGW